jgi:enamine deaminase RidA (YjgF/YER057c/UK114 family)
MGYTHVVETRGGLRTIYISGQVALDVAGNMVGVGDMRAQAEQVFANIKAALTAVHATFDDVVKLTYFVTDITQMPAVREVRDQHIRLDQLPASTAVEVRRLVRPEFWLEVEAVAVLAE